MRPQMDAFRPEALWKASAIAICGNSADKFWEGIHKKQEGDTQ
jgi:hypothetical protein